MSGLAALAMFPVAANAGTIGLAITDWRYALYETPGAKEECPNGLQASEIEQFKAEPDPVGRLKKFIGTTASRGPNGETANQNPLMVEDALPWQELQTARGYGVSLDGTTDGRATAKTCKHEKFTGPEDEPVDNQMARVLGCVQGWRSSGFSAETYSDNVVTSPTNRYLIEITGVDDEQNDPSVEVTIFKGRDRLMRMATGAYLPHMSHRLDERFPQYTFQTNGKIVDGVLTTDPISFVRLPMLQVEITGERHIRDFTLRIKLGPDHAEGYVAGYEPLDTWWNNHSKNPASGIGRYSPAGLYRALHRHADGYPDPQTGACTAISVTHKIKAVRALIVHPPKTRPFVAGSFDQFATLAQK